jgi:predicted DNA-binding transcriptional regulator AlpA
LINNNVTEVFMRTIPETGFVRLPQVLAVIPVSKTCWWRGVKSGRYPKPVKISEHCTAWRVEDIHNLIRCLAEQNQPSLN